MNVCSAKCTFFIFWVLLKHIHTSAAHNTTHHSRLNLSDHGVGRVAGDDLRVMQHVELLRRIAAGVQQDRLLSSGVVQKELRHVEHLSVDEHSDVVFLVVLQDFLGHELLRARAGGRRCVSSLSGLCGGLFGGSGGDGGR